MIREKLNVEELENLAGGCGSSGKFYTIECPHCGHHQMQEALKD